MSSRIGPGPVFVYESLMFTRRRQLYAGRMLFVLAVLVGLSISWWNNLNSPGIGQQFDTGPGAIEAMARAGVSFFYAITGIQLSIVLLVAPAATAGAICQDRAGECWRRWRPLISPTRRSCWASCARGWRRSWRFWPAACR